MEADEGNVIGIGGVYGTEQEGGADDDPYEIEEDEKDDQQIEHDIGDDAGPEVGTDEEEEDADMDDSEMEDDDDIDDDKKYDKHKQYLFKATAIQSPPVVDPEDSEISGLKMPQMKTVMSDLRQLYGQRDGGEGAGQSADQAAAWPEGWTKRLLLVRGLSSRTNPKDLQPIFPGAEAVIVAPDVTVLNKRRDKAVKRGDDGYAYVLYNDEDTAKATVEKYTEHPPVLKFALDVKLYREPVELPRGYLLLRPRMVVLRHLASLKKKIEKSKKNPDVKVPPDAEKRIARCKELIEGDNVARRQLGLRAPTLKDYEQMRGFKPMRLCVYRGLLHRHGIMEYPPATVSKTQKRNAEKRRQMMREGVAFQPFYGARHAGYGDDLPYPPTRLRFGGSRFSAYERFGRGFRGGGRPYPSSGGYGFGEEQTWSQTTGQGRAEMQRWKEAMSAPGPVTTPLGTRTGRKGVLGEPPAKLMRTCHSVAAGFYALNMDPSMYGAEMDPSMYGAEMDPSMYGYEMDPSMYGFEMDPSMYGYEMDPSMYGYDMDPSTYTSGPSLVRSWSRGDPVGKEDWMY